MARKCACAAAASAFSAMATSPAWAKRSMIISADLAALSRPERAEHGLCRSSLRQAVAAGSASCSARRRRWPGTANLLTSAALAHANRLPMLMLCGDVFLTRLPDPVLQQLEHFGNPAMGLNDAFKAVSRYWDRITHPAQIIQSLPCGDRHHARPWPIAARRFSACRRMCRAGPMTTRWNFFDEEGVPHPPPGARRSVKLPMPRRRSLKAAQRPVIIAGGGVQYSRAVKKLTAFAEKPGRSL
jgi:3D-(3,5/4)-trihydroxycyclohexane-1,2-dione acylhydrolase (decyclizing)